MDRKFLMMIANQTGAEMLPDNAQWKNRLEIKSETSSRLYIVAQHKTNFAWGCSCPGYKSRRKCKHLIAMVPLFERAQSFKAVS